MTQFDSQYREAIREIMNHGLREVNERTGHSTMALPGVTFNLNAGFPILTLRKIPIKLFVAEQIWYLTGSNSPDPFLTKFTKIWDDFKEADGTLPAAYGYRWRVHFGRDQIKDLINLLATQPGSRHGVVMAWDPADDGLGSGTPKKNVPCPFTFAVNIIANKLHLHSIVRSNDMMLGAPHDVAGFALLQTILAAKLGYQVGTLTHSISNAHIYDTHYDQAWELVERENDHSEMFLEAQPDYFDRAEAADEALVEEITTKLTDQYKPLGPIKGLKIVL